ncbi:MAG: DUF2252 domain-containing protein [Gimesia sp.]|nr:DUF2252 domain-containing protein [Gimesia sp.]
MNQQSQTPDERYEYGRSLREQTPLESHAEWSPATRLADPVALIEEQNTRRVPWLVPVRRKRMSRSSFTFFRGGARIMASDLAQTPNSGIQTQLCGDAHLANFGVYASPERRLVFDLNDFDETLPGPWEWDVKRLAASLCIAARHNGLNEKRTHKITQRTVAAYRNAIEEFSRMRVTDIWYNLFESDRMIEMLKGKKLKRGARKVVEKAMRKDSRHALDRLAEEVNGKYRIRSAPPLLIPARDLPETDMRDQIQSIVLESFEQYRKNASDEMEHLLGNFRVIDFAVKVVGVGSVGTRCAILLLEGRDRNDPLFLQIKQAEKSVLEEYLPKSRYQNSGERVVQGQRLMQGATDIFLGWTESKKTGNQFYWRQLKDWKGSADVDNLDYKKLNYLATIRGWNLARSHARTGDAIAISGYLGSGTKFEKAITEFSARYADQNDRDYEAFMTEIHDGRLEVSIDDKT